jgi:hypothetical protein
MEKNMPKELPESISIDDAVALILSFSYTPGTNSLRDMFSYFKEDAESKLDHAVTQFERDKYNTLLNLYEIRIELAEALYAVIGVELNNIRQKKESALEVYDDRFNSEKLVTASVCSWAYDLGFGIEGWQPPRFWRKKGERNYSTEYLDILDDVIATFCEEGGEYYQSGITPKKEAVITWIEGKYGPLSKKVLDVIATLIRPGLTQPPENKPRRM